MIKTKIDKSFLSKRHGKIITSHKNIGQTDFSPETTEIHRKKMISSSWWSY